jgi:hypothetical protein
MANEQANGQTNEKPKTAAARIKNLEDALLGLIKAFNGAVNEQEVIKEALRLLSNKLDSTISLIRAGQELNDQNISTVMTQNRANKLANDVQAAVQGGVVSPSAIIDANSFVVCRVLNDDGTVQNPRLQFTLASEQALAPALLGHKVLDKVTMEGKTGSLEVMEIYTVNQTAPQAVAPTEAPTDLSSAPPSTSSPSPALDTPAASATA